jgi:hypothetical protein
MAGKLRSSEYLTLVGALLLFISTFSAWFSMPSVIDLKEVAPDAILDTRGGGGVAFLNVWDLPVARWFVYAAILCAAWMFFAALFSENPEWAVILATPTVVFGGLAVLCLVYRLIDAPHDNASPEPMYYAAVAGSVLLFVGACWAIRDETVPAGFQPTPEPELVDLDASLPDAGMHLDSAP